MPIRSGKTLTNIWELKEDRPEPREPGRSLQMRLARQVLPRSSRALQAISRIRLFIPKVIGNSEGFETMGGLGQTLF